MPFDPRYLRHSFRPRTQRIGSGSASDEIAYFDSGAPRSRGSDGAPILLLHGFTADKETWLWIARRLGEDHRLIAPDLAGHGASGEAADGRYGIVRQAERARALVESLTPAVGRHHVLGHSMGGGVAAEYAIRNPADLLSLGLIAPAVAKRPHTDEFYELIGRCINPLIVAPGWRLVDKIRYVTRGPWWLHLISAAVSPWMNRRARARQAHHEAIFAQLAPSVRKPSHCSAAGSLQPAHPDQERPSYTGDDFSGIRRPTFILWGAEDRVLAPNPGVITSGMAPGIPAHAEEPWEKTGHTPIIERPTATAKAYLAFLDGLSSPPDSARTGG